MVILLLLRKYPRVDELIRKKNQILSYCQKPNQPISYTKIKLLQSCICFLYKALIFFFFLVTLVTSIPLTLVFIAGLTMGQYFRANSPQMNKFRYTGSTAPEYDLHPSYLIKKISYPGFIKTLPK